MSKYDTAAMRERLKKQMNRSADPNEFRAPKVIGDKKATFRFFVLPPLTEGDPCAGGTASRTMDQCWIPFAQHWVHKPYSCPRVASEGELGCPMCTKGFALIKEAKDHGATKDQISALAKAWLPTNANTVNIYFPVSPANPEEYHGRVMYYRCQKAVYDLFKECLNREDHVDDEAPKAFGAFFDEEAAFLFDLTVKCKDGYNNYAASSFLPACRPIAARKDGSPDRKAIDTIMAARHDLYTKGDTPSVKAMSDLVTKLWDGDDAADEGSGGFTQEEEEVESRTVRRPTSPAARPVAKAAPVQEEEVEEAEVEEAEVEVEAPFEPAPQPRPTRAPLKAKAASDEEELKPPVRKPKAAPVVAESLDGEEEVVTPPPAKKSAAVNTVDDLLSQLESDAF